MHQEVLFFFILGLGAISFVVFLIGAFFDFFRKGDDAGKHVETIKRKSQDFLPSNANAADLVSVVKIFGDIVGTLTKVSSGIAALGATVLFVGIAAWMIADPSSTKLESCTIPADTAIKTDGTKLTSAVTVKCEAAKKPEATN